MLRSYLAPLLLLLCFTSCTSVQRNITGVGVVPEANIAPVQGTTKAIDVLLSGDVTFKTYFGLFTSGPKQRAIMTGDTQSFGRGGMRSFKEAALYQALAPTQYDIIINPKYLITEQKGLFVRTTNVKVVGYAGEVEFFE